MLMHRNQYGASCPTCCQSSHAETFCSRESLLQKEVVQSSFHVHRWQCVILLICLFSLPQSLWATINDPKTIHIGVLAEEGKDQCFSRWRDTATYVQQYNP